MNEELERERGVRLAARIGVNTGEVVAGDSATRQTLVTGDAVNVAARLEQNTLLTPHERDADLKKVRKCAAFRAIP